MGVIAKYKFNNTLADLLPEFNSEFTSDLYTVTDEINGDVTTRTIESDSLPTLMRFGSNLETYVEGNELALLEVLDMNTSGLTNCYRMFRYCKNLTSITCEWNTSSVTNMVSMFHSCNNLTTLDVSNFDTSKLTSMNSMFHSCTKLTSLDVSNWDTSKVTNTGYMFHSCAKLTTLDVSNFDTSNVTTMQSMFYNCNNLTSLDLSNWDTLSVTNMQSMFYNCKSLTTLDVSNFNTSKVIAMHYMFDQCTSLKTLDCRNFNMTKVSIAQYMFSGCRNLKSLDISNCSINQAANMQSFFASVRLDYLKCNNINTLSLLYKHLDTKSSTSQGTIICKSDITNLDTTTLQSKYWNILDEPTLIAKYVFDKSIHNNYIPEFNTEFEGYFIEDEVVEGSNEVIRTIESCGMLPTMVKFGVVNEANDYSKSLSSILYMNTNNITNMRSMFDWCINLREVNTNNWNTSNATTMQGMFYKCLNLTSLDLSNFDTSNVTDMRDMFCYCNKLTSLDVSNFNTNKVTNMKGMFQGCYNLITLDVSNWNTSKVTNMEYMFYYCNSLTSLDVSNFNTSNVTNTTNMFTNTPLLTDISVLYMDKSSLQKLVDVIPTDLNKTLWYKDVNIDGITHGDNITLKKYMEENVEIVLNSPLLEGDRIEVKDGKLCHYHKKGMVVLDGSENWFFTPLPATGLENYTGFKSPIENGKPTTANTNYVIDTHGFSNLELNTINNNGNTTSEAITVHSDGNIYIRILKSKLSTLNADGFKQWLQANPTTVVYELAEPYYEDITNLQSAPTLKTYLECSMEIDTDLPIDTNVTYRTNLSSVYVMERELDELDNGTDLSDILEGEVNE